MTIKPDVLHEQLATALPAMKLVSDSYSGEPYVSAYLPNPSPSYEDPLISHARFEAYKERANYYNVTRRTVQSLVGSAFGSLGNLFFVKVIRVINHRVFAKHHADK